MQVQSTRVKTREFYGKNKWNMKRYARRTCTVWTVLVPFLLIVSEVPQHCMWFTNIKVECPHTCHSLKKIMVQLQFYWNQSHFSTEAWQEEQPPAQVSQLIHLDFTYTSNSEQSLASGTEMASGTMWLTFKWLSFPFPAHSWIASSIPLVRKRPQPVVLPKPCHGPNRDMHYVLPKASAWASALSRGWACSLALFL